MSDEEVITSLPPEESEELTVGTPFLRSDPPDKVTEEEEEIYESGTE